MLCPECEKRRIAEGHETCYPCHIRSLGFTYKGAAYGRASWNNQTIRERQREVTGGLPNVEPI